MIHFRNLSLARGARRLIDQANLQIHAGWRVGLVGANGSGKSSLFSLLKGELQAEGGDFLLPASWQIAVVAQETPALEKPAIEYVLDGDTELRQIQAKLLVIESMPEKAQEMGELHARLNDIGGYGARSRAASLLSGLGFAEEQFERAVATFSGGWRMRLNLAQALVSRSELMLLDEPTNHLDLDAVVWLEKWLASFRGTLMVVSHDRDFLDGCVSHIVQLDQPRMTLYTGNYTSFETQRAAQLAVQQSLHEKQQRRVAHLQSYISRFRAQATKARQAQSRLKALDRMQLVSAAHVDTPFDFSFLKPEQGPDPLLTLADTDVGYDGQAILAGIQWTLRPGARIGLLGPNGAGKSTLIKLLSGETSTLRGHFSQGRGLNIGYFAQHQLEQLRPEESALRHLMRLEPLTREQELRNYLGGFDFRGDMVDCPVSPFSGGEKSRLALALLIRTRPNLLLLDEPTNHLDLEMRHALNVAMAEYEGSLVLVSHDRSLMRSVCDDFLLVADGRVQPFPGDVDDYLEWLRLRRQEQIHAGAVPEENASGRQKHQMAKQEREVLLQKKRVLKKELQGLDRNLSVWAEEKSTLDRQLADPLFYQNPDANQLRVMNKRHAELVQWIDEAESRWLMAQEQMDGLGV